MATWATARHAQWLVVNVLPINASRVQGTCHVNSPDRIGSDISVASTRIQTTVASQAVKLLQNQFFQRCKTEIATTRFGLMAWWVQTESEKTSRESHGIRNFSHNVHKLYGVSDGSEKISK